MTLLVWAGLFCLSFTWLFTLGLYTAESDAWWIGLLGAGVLFNASAFAGRAVFKSLDKTFLFMCIPLLLCLMILPFPCNLGVIVTLSGILLLLLSKPVPPLAGPACGVLLSGVILLLQSPLGYLYTTFTSYSHYLYWLDPMFQKIFSFFDLDVAYSQHTLFIRTIKDVYAFPTTWEKLAVFPFISILVGSIPVFYLFSERTHRLRNIARLLFSGAVFVIVRYVFMILLFLYLMTFVEHGEEICRIDIFWNMKVTLLTFLPFMAIAHLFIPLKTGKQAVSISFEKESFPRSSRRALIWLCLAAFFLGLGFGFQDPGKQKTGRIILDESRSQWEKSTRKMDTEWYGNESGYNFYWIAEYINHYFPLKRNTAPITPELLSQCDVLIIKTPTGEFSPEEIRHIKDFVLNGGGLFLIGEHTNVFGTSTYLNPIAEEFGFSFRYDVILDINRKFEQLYVPPKLMPHPVVQNMPYFAFKVSCSIQPLSSKCEGVMVSRALKAQDVYYPSGNFYPPVKDHTDLPFGAFLQMAGIKAGKGRVLGFTDSTSYSNFEAFIEGKPELMLGALAWLNRENRWAFLNTVFFILFAVCLAAGARTLRDERHRIHDFLLLTVLGVFFVSVAVVLCQALSRTAYPPPRPATPYTRVVFEQAHGDYELPLKGFTKKHDECYEVFYLWMLRTENYPVTGKTLAEDITGNPDILVIINPHKRFSGKEVTLVKDYIEKGGNVLLMDRKKNKDSTANELLVPLGMKIVRETDATIPPPYGFSAYGKSDRNSSVAVEGGTALLYSPGGAPILSTARVGKGMIAALGFSQLFVNSNMGGSYRVSPDQRLRAIYDLEFGIVRGLLSGDVESVIRNFKMESNR